jgi:hypothetical protein
VDAEVQATINNAVVQTLESPDPNEKSISLPSHYDCRKSYYELYNQLIKT